MLKPLAALTAPLILLGVIGSGPASAVSPAPATVITFDELSGNAPLPVDQYAAQGVHIAGTNHYDSPQSPYNAHSGSTRLYGYQPSGSTRITFDRAQTAVGAWLAGSGQAWLTCADQDGATLGESAHVQLSATPQNVTVTANGIRTCYLYAAPGSWVLDDLTFDPLATIDAADALITQDNQQSVPVTFSRPGTEPTTAYVRFCSTSSPDLCTGVLTSEFADGDTTAHSLTFNVATLPDGPLTANLGFTGVESAATDSATKDTSGPAGTVVFTTDPVTAANAGAVQVTLTAGTDPFTGTVQLCDEWPHCTPTQPVSFATGDDAAQVLTFDTTGDNGSVKLNDGTLHAVVTLTDTDGNDSAPTATASKDSTGPEVQLDSTADEITADNQAHMPVDVSTPGGEPVSGSVKVCDAADPSVCTATQTVEFTPNETLHSLSFDVTSLGDGTVTVLGVFTDALGNTSTSSTSEDKNTAVVVSPDPVAPSAPTDVAGSQAATHQARVTFNPPTEPGDQTITGYRVTLNNDADYSDEQLVGADIREALFGGVPVGTLYAAVQAVTADTVGEFGQTSFAMTQADPPVIAPNSDPTTSPTASSSASPTASHRRAAVTLVAKSPLINAGNTARLVGTGDANEAFSLRCYTRPSTTYVESRTGTFDANGVASFVLSLGRNTRCFLQYATNGDQDRSTSVVVRVRTVLSVSAFRKAPRTVVFYGRNLPRVGGQLITLYRVDHNGDEVRTANLRSDDSGVYRVTRTFTGGGTFAFRIRTSDTPENAPGASGTVLVTLT